MKFDEGEVLFIMINIKKGLFEISMGLIALGTIGLASILYYDSKIETIQEHKDVTLLKHNMVIDYMHSALSDITEVTITHDHIDILKKLNASKPLIEKREAKALEFYANAASRAITAAKATHTISEIQQADAMKLLLSNPNSNYFDSIYMTYSKIAGEGTISQGDSLISSTDQINKLREKKTSFWFGSIVLNAFGGVLAIISSCLKENKNNTTLSSVTTPVKKENQEGYKNESRANL